MDWMKYLHVRLSDHFLKQIDEYVEKVNESHIYSMKYKRTILFVDAVKYYIDNNLALKNK